MKTKKVKSKKLLSKSCVLFTTLFLEFNQITKDKTTIRENLPFNLFVSPSLPLFSIFYNFYQLKLVQTKRSFSRFSLHPFFHFKLSLNFSLHSIKLKTTSKTVERRQLVQSRRSAKAKVPAVGAEC